MRRRSCCELGMVLLALASLGHLRADDDKKPDKEKVAAEDKKFEGEWVITKVETNGRTVTEESLGGMTFTFKGKKYEQKQGGRVLETGTQDLDPTKKPKHMDVTVSESEEDTVGKKQLAIYEIEGDKLRACFARHGDKGRPTKFESKDGSDHTYLEMKRKK